MHFCGRSPGLEVYLSKQRTLNLSPPPLRASSPVSAQQAALRLTWNDPWPTLSLPVGRRGNPPGSSGILKGTCFLGSQIQLYPAVGRGGESSVAGSMQPLVCLGWDQTQRPTYTTEIWGVQAAAPSSLLGGLRASGQVLIGRTLRQGCGHSYPGRGMWQGRDLTWSVGTLLQTHLSSGLVPGPGGALQDRKGESWGLGAAKR